MIIFTVLYCIVTMAEAGSIHKLRKEDVQSILEGYSDNESDRSLPQVPNETISLSSVRQNLSMSFNRLRRDITDRMADTQINLKINQLQRWTQTNCHQIVCILN